MIWFIIVITALVIGIIGIILCVLLDFEWLGAFNTFLLAFGSFIALVIMIPCAIGEHINIDAKIVNLEAKREALVYELENETYLNDNNLGSTELFNNIISFNQKILVSRAKHESPWTNWFYGDYWYEVEPIELPAN